MPVAAPATWQPSGDHTENSSLSSVVTISTASVDGILAQALGQNIRYTLDGSTPDANTGFVLAADGDPLLIPTPGVTLKVIEETATATLQYQAVAWV